jgi:hypothetical protein
MVVIWRLVRGFLIGTYLAAGIYTSPSIICLYLQEQSESILIHLSLFVKILNEAHTLFLPSPYSCNVLVCVRTLNGK